jgi:hypothetical protein
MGPRKRPLSFRAANGIGADVHIESLRDAASKQARLL